MLTLQYEHDRQSQQTFFIQLMHGFFTLYLSDINIRSILPVHDIYQSVAKFGILT